MPDDYDYFSAGERIQIKAVYGREPRINRIGAKHWCYETADDTVLVILEKIRDREADLVRYEKMKWYREYRVVLKEIEKLNEELFTVAGLKRRKKYEVSMFIFYPNGDRHKRVNEVIAFDSHDAGILACTFKSYGEPIIDQIISHGYVGEPVRVKVVDGN